MAIKCGSNKKISTYFPIGTTPLEAIDMVKDAIKNTGKITNVTPIGRTDKIIYEAINHKQQQVFRLCIKNNIVQFYPIVK